MNVGDKFLGTIFGMGVEGGKDNRSSIDAETFRKLSDLKCVGINKPNR